MNLSARTPLIVLMVTIAAMIALPIVAQAADPYTSLQRRIEKIEKQLRKMKGLQAELNGLKRQLQAAQKKAVASEQKAVASEQKAAAAERSAATAAGKALSEQNTLIKWHVSGAVAANFAATDAKGKHNQFVGGTFLPIFLAQYSNWLLFEGHLEFNTTSEGETEASLEYAQADIMATDWLTLVAGKFLSPVGQFQQFQHPPWINKLPDRPAGFVEDGGDEPLTEVGVMARGGVPLGKMRGTYAVYLGNGPRLSDTGPALEGFAGDNNEDKAFGGRVSLFPVPSLEIGFSGTRTTIKGIQAQSGSATSADYDLIDGDFAFTKGPWDVRGEVIHSHLDSLASAFDPSDPMPTAIPATDWTNWYAQVAYRLSGLTHDPTLGRFEPVLRYGQFHIHGFDQFRENEENRLSVGLDYWFAPSVVAKIAYENRHFALQPHENVFRMQFAYGF
jgi:hypothetical protein